MARPPRSTAEEERRRDIRSLLASTVIILGIQNALVILWGYTLHGQSGGPDGRPYDGYGIYVIAMLCSAAASFVGGLPGFLFGIPRAAEGLAEAAATRRQTPPAEPSPSESQPALVEPAPPQPAPPQQGGPSAAQPTDGADGPAVADRGQPRLRSNSNLESISDALTKALLGISLTQLHQVGPLIDRVTSGLGPSFGPGTAGGIVAVCVLIYGAAEGFLFGYLATRVYLTGIFIRNDPRPA